MSRLITASRFFTWIFLTGLSLSLLMASAFYLYLRPGLPSVDQLMDIRLQTPLRVYSADEELIAEFGEKRRTPVTIEQIPTVQLQAFLAAEDARFYDHSGVDLRGLVRAAVELVTTGSIQSGGSTITMQVAKNYFLTRDRTFIRKFNEILLALQIERELDKDRILELYLNKIYLGNRAYGLAAAAQVYYGRPVHELSLPEMAMLAGLPKAPSAYNPLADPQRALIRRNWILGRMRDLGYITADTHELAAGAPLSARYNAPRTALDADHVAEMARAEMVARYGESVYTDGYQVSVTIDSRKQRAANQALQDGLEAYSRRHGYRGAVARVAPESLDTAEPDTLLENHPRVGDLYPAVVLAVRDKEGEVDLHSRHLGQVVMPFDTMTWARRRIDLDRMGPEPEQASDVVAAGDIVYVRRHQVPDLEQAPETEASQGGDGDMAAAPLVPTIEVALSQIPAIEGALVSLEAGTGAIKALAGGYSFSQNKYNRATQAQRQPGSTFKPFVYLAALEKGMSAATIYNDAPIVFEAEELETAWRPQNSGGQFFGPMRLREALYRSRNLVSIRLLQDLGINNTLDYLQRLGIPTGDLQKDLSLALGSGSLTPMELARGFALIANGGYRVDPYLIQTIRDSNDEVLYEAPPVVQCDTACTSLVELTPTPIAGFPALRVAPRVADERAVYILHSMLRDVVKRGTGRRALALGRDDIGGKTGTTNEQRDAWFAGFNHELVATAWVGFDQPRPMGRGEFGAVAALPVWLDYMRVALEGQPPAFMRQPNGIVSVKIDPDTGQRALPGQTDAVFELFREENAPRALEQDQYGNDASNGGDGDSVPRDLF